jgi:hypothetical protein
VLNREITADIAEKVGDIRYAFSGDDHDYCEVLHKAYTSAGGGIREITVKSTSWAMGVRLPSVQLVSLWNPVDVYGNPKNGDASKTIQTKLCLLPDQIGTFLKYGMLFGLTLSLLVLRAGLITLGVVSSGETDMTTTTTESPLLPITNTPSPATAEKESHSSNSSTSSERTGNLSVRSTTQTRNNNNNNNTLQQSKYNLPLIQHAGYDATKDYYDDDDMDHHDRDKKKVRVYGVASTKVSSKPRKRRKGFALFWWELRMSLRTVVVLGGVWYGYLVWRG